MSLPHTLHQLLAKTGSSLAVDTKESVTLAHNGLTSLVASFTIFARSPSNCACLLSLFYELSASTRQCMHTSTTAHVHLSIAIRAHSDGADGPLCIVVALSSARVSDSDPLPVGVAVKTCWKSGPAVCSQAPHHPRLVKRNNTIDTIIRSLHTRTQTCIVASAACKGTTTLCSTTWGR